MDPIQSIGKLLSENEKRDAIHIAILPVVTAEDLQPGDHVSIRYGTNQVEHTPTSLKSDNRVGIIDPFLNLRVVPKGSRVYLFLYPNTVTGMRHEWSCPAVDGTTTLSPPEDDKEEHEKWLRNFAKKWNYDYDELTIDAQKDGGHIVAGSTSSSPEDMGSDYEEFWDHLEALAGQKFNAHHRGCITWSCAC